MIPKVLMVQCSNSGTAYWRMFSWWEAAYRTKKGFFHVLGWQKDSEQADWQWQIADPENQPALFGRLYHAAIEANAIVFGRVETKAALTTFYALRDQFPNKAILSEIDDDITDVAPYNMASELLKPGSDRTAIGLQQFRDSDGLIVSTPYLKEVYAEYNENIYVIQNSIDFVRWGKVQAKRKPGIRIGWIGGATHSEDIKLLASVIPALTAHNPEVRFVFASSMVPEEIAKLPGVETVLGWSPILKYPQYLGKLDFDIGVAPLRDNKFNRAKSNLRWLEYSALGIPCVASDVGHFSETIRHGIDGFLATDPAAFVEHLKSLVDSVKLRKKIGSAAKRRVEADFNIERNVSLYIDAINDTLSRPRKTAPSINTGVDDTPHLPEPELSPLEVTTQ